MGFLGCLLMCGCMTQRSQMTSSQPAYTPQIDTPALALACEPPITANQPALYLDRESREPAAFAGYDQPTVTYSDLQVNDNYQPFHDGSYERQAISERIGVSTR
jgi:hypothetical protein